MNYPRAIKTILAVRQMSQRELAAEMGVSESQISRLGKEQHSPSSKTLEKLADALRVPVYLLVLLASEQGELPGMSEEQAAALGKQLLSMLLDVEKAAPKPRKKKTTAA